MASGIKGSTLAWLSSIIYESESEFQRHCNSASYTVVQYFDYRDTQAALVVGWANACIVFRGTEASSWNMRDIFSNVTWPYPTTWQGPGRVHSGYRRHLNYIGHEALEMAKNVGSDIPLTVTGHSLGGAIATLFASWYFFEYPDYKLHSLVTFGAPKSVDRKAAAAISCPINVYQVRGDFAPYWPPVIGLGNPPPALTLPPRKESDGLLQRHDVQWYVEAMKEMEQSGSKNRGGWIASEGK